MRGVDPYTGVSLQCMPVPAFREELEALQLAAVAMPNQGGGQEAAIVLPPRLQLNPTSACCRGRKAVGLRCDAGCPCVDWSLSAISSGEMPAGEAAAAAQHRADDEERLRTGRFPIACDAVRRRRFRFG